MFLHQNHRPAQFRQRRVCRGEAAVEADCQRAFVSLGQFDQLPCAVEAGREGLVHQYVDTSGQHVGDDLHVRFGGGVHECDVQATVEEFIEPGDAPGRDVLACVPREPVGVTGHQRQLDVSARGERRQVGLLGDVTEPDDPYPQWPTAWCHAAFPSR